MLFSVLIADTSFADSTGGSSNVSSEWDGTNLILTTTADEAFATVLFKITLGQTVIEWSSRPVALSKDGPTLFRPEWPEVLVERAAANGIGTVSALVLPKDGRGEIIGHADAAPFRAVRVIDGNVYSLAESPLLLARTIESSILDADEAIATVDSDVMEVR
jgi:hypothetical protein